MGLHSFSFRLWLVVKSCVLLLQRDPTVSLALLLLVVAARPHSVSCTASSCCCSAAVQLRGVRAAGGRGRERAGGSRRLRADGERARAASGAAPAQSHLPPRPLLLHPRRRRKY